MLIYEDHTPGSNLRGIDAHKAVVTALAFSSDGFTLASGARDGSMVLRDMDGAIHPLLERTPQSPAVNAIVFLPDGAVAIGHAQGWLVHRRDIDTYRIFAPPKGSPATALGAIDAATLAVGTGDRNKPTAGNLELWDVSTGRRLEPYFQEPYGVRALAVCPAKKLVAWATGQRKVTVWDIHRQDPIHFNLGKNSPAVAIAADGTLLAAAVDYEIKVYDLAKKRERAPLKGHKGQVTSVAISPDGATIATGSWDQTVKLWDAATGQERAAFQWPIGRICSLAYAPDGLRLAAGGDIGTVVVWDMD